MRVLGAILVGGTARRFGSDKALAALDGVPLIERVRLALAPQVEGIAICGRGWPGLVSLADRPSGGLGPLGGLAAALHHAQAHGFDAVLSAPCDTPLLPANLRERLAGEGPRYVIDAPVIGLWPATLAETLGRFIEEDARRSMRGWAECAGATAVALAGPIENVNTVADLDRLAQRRR